MKQNNRNKRSGLILIATMFFFVFSIPSFGQKTENLLSSSYITNEFNEVDFVLSASGISSALLVDANDYPGVIRVAKYLQEDIYRLPKAT